MPKNICLRLLTVITMFFISTAFTHTYAQGLLKKSDDLPSIHGAKTFLIYAEKGNLQTFNQSGKMVKSEEVKDFRDGELLYIITGPKSAIFSANTGISEVEYVKDTNAVTFIETTPVRNKHIMIIEDKWDVKEKGFKFTYTRNITGEFGTNVRSIYIGIAKPTLQYKPPRRAILTDPSLQETRIFSVFAQDGNFKSFNIESGKLLESTKANDFRNGEIVFLITGLNNAIMSGNLGTAKVELVKDDDFLTFIETTPLGNKNIMVIANEWDAKEKGFKFTYIRNIKSILSGNFLRSIYSGIVRPTIN